MTGVLALAPSTNPDVKVGDVIRILNWRFDTTHEVRILSIENEGEDTYYVYEVEGLTEEETRIRWLSGGCVFANGRWEDGEF